MTCQIQSRRKGPKNVFWIIRLGLQRTTFWKAEQGKIKRNAFEICSVKTDKGHNNVYRGGGKLESTRQNHTQRHDPMWAYTDTHDCAHTIGFLLSPFMSLHYISLSEDDVLGKGIQQSSPDILVHLKKNFHQCEVTMRTQKRGIKTILFIYLCIII